MVWYDLLVLGIVVAAAIRGAMKGFVWQLATISTLIFCFIFAESASVVIAPAIPAEPPLNRWIAMAILYLVFSFVTYSLARQLQGWMEKAKFTEYDRHLGGLFGFIKGATFCIVMTFFAVTLSETMCQTVMDSKSGYASAYLLNKLHPVMPSELHAVLGPYFEKWDNPESHGHEHQHAHNLPKITKPSSGIPPFDQFPNSQQPGSNPASGFPPFVNSPNDSDDWQQPFGVPFGAMLDQEFWQAIQRSIERTPPEERENFRQKINSLTPDELQKLAQVWRSNQPASSLPSTNPNSGTLAPAGGEFDSMLREISQLLADMPEDQQSIVREVQHSLRGIPDRVATAVVRDWYADLKALPNDPDPQTKLTTPLEERIRRQLSQHQVPFNTLSEGVRDRLRQ